MALVVFLRGVNVGAHRTLRPTTLAEQLKHLDAINIGAAGTFVVRRPVTPAQVRTELAHRLPFDAEIVICQGHEIVRLMSQNHFADQPVRPDIVRFVSVLSKRPRSAPSTPMSLPSSGKWLLKILARDNQFVFGVYRRHMKVISYLGKIDRLFGVPVTTRNWNTITAIAKVLDNSATARPGKRRQVQLYEKTTPVCNHNLLDSVCHKWTVFAARAPKAAAGGLIVPDEGDRRRQSQGRTPEGGRRGERTNAASRDRRRRRAR